ncbi:putative phage endopeptidase [Candidatus Regiella insecticola LSR1]|uniref:Putative phage endopeptidase n=1 Tax=Candidatus Regiella insecticola LSR1 TaxID=663321 RepID=E0WUM4_9ENTR|nr:lysis protein [Candidatus Regiella insecticola]EFL91285.1 putative phage endopeptidase [Candidatus Regiella insecticola LSR1]
MYFRLMTLFIIILTGFLFYYQGRCLYQEKHYQKEIAEKNNIITTLNEDLLATTKNIKKMKDQQQIITATDKKYTEELAHAKAHIERLRFALINGDKRLRLNARCDLSTAPPATEMDDATAPRLSNTVEWNYFSLREHIATATIQIAGLQDYINNVCLAK